MTPQERSEALDAAWAHRLYRVRAAQLTKERALAAAEAAYQSKIGAVNATYDNEVAQIVDAPGTPFCVIGDDGYCNCRSCADG